MPNPEIQFRCLGWCADEEITLPIIPHLGMTKRITLTIPANAEYLAYNPLFSGNADVAGVYRAPVELLYFDAAKRYLGEEIVSDEDGTLYERLAFTFFKISPVTSSSM